MLSPTSISRLKFGMTTEIWGAGTMITRLLKTVTKREFSEVCVRVAHLNHLRQRARTALSASSRFGVCADMAVRTPIVRSWAEPSMFYLPNQGHELIGGAK